MRSLFQKSDTQLVRQTLGGRREAFSILVKRHQDLVFSVAYGIVAHVADAEDVTQETFLEAFNRLPSLREPGKFRGWLLAIARNIASDVICRRAKARTLSNPAAENITPPPSVAEAELQALLRERIERLPEEYREVLLLHYYAGYRIREIALQLDISTEAAKKRLQRARDLLSQRMLAQFRDTLEVESPSASRTKSIIALIAGTTPVWYGTHAAAAGTFTGVAAVKLVSSGILLAATAAAVVVASTAGQGKPLLPENAGSSVETPVSIPDPPPETASPFDTADASGAAPPTTRAIAGTPDGTGIIRGQVLSASGVPQAGVQVTADARTEDGGSHHEIVTDTEGHFELARLQHRFPYLLQAAGHGGYDAQLV